MSVLMKVNIRLVWVLQCTATQVTRVTVKNQLITTQSSQVPDGLDKFQLTMQSSQGPDGLDKFQISKLTQGKKQHYIAQNVRKSNFIQTSKCNKI